MQTKRFLTATLVSLLAVAVAACGAASTDQREPRDEPQPTHENAPPVEPTDTPDVDHPPISGLEGVTWVLTGYLNREGGFTKPLPDRDATARFEVGKLSGSAGCNSFFSSYELDGNELSIDALGVTEMYCSPDELMAQETDVLAALGRVASWKLEGDDLELRDESGSLVLSFSKPQLAALVGTFWRLVSLYDGQGGVRSVLAGTEITATLDDDGNLAGSAGCNHYFATVEVSGNTISFVGPVGSTVMACGEPEGIMEQEMDFLAALQRFATYEIVGQSLMLLDARGEPVLTFVAVEPTALVGTRWEVIACNNGRGGVTSVLLGTELTVTFGADGRVTGSAGCNSYFADYELDGQTITIGQAGITKMFCAEPEGVMDQETEFVSALQRAATFVIEADRLQLRDANGALQVDLVRAETASIE